MKEFRGALEAKSQPMPGTARALTGVLPVLLTPFDERGAVDHASLAREVDWVFACGAGGVVLAMVSEIYRLGDAERDALVEATVRAVRGRGPSIASVGAESTELAIRHARAAERAGAQAVMAVPPVFTRCNASELKAYYEALLDATELPVIVQDASGFVGSAVPLAVQTGLYREHPHRILFKPEGASRTETIAALNEATQGKAPVFDGMSGVALADHFARGLAGVMPGADLTWTVAALWRALSEGNNERVWTIQAPLSALIALMQSLDGYVAIGKWLLQKQGVFDNRRMRGPSAFRLDAATERSVEALFGRLKRACN